MPAARYWRVFIDRAGGECSCLNLRLFRDQEATQEVRGGTTVASSVYAGAAYDGSKCRDDDPRTFWASTTNRNVTLSIDFGEGVEPSLSAFSWQARTDGYHGQSLLSGGLEFSRDGQTYHRVVQADCDGWASGQVRTFSGLAPDPDGGVRRALPFSGSGVPLTVAAGTSSIRARLFGAGGAGGVYGRGRYGGGGFAEVEWPVQPGDVVLVQVPQGGQQASGGDWSAGGWPDGGYGAAGDTNPGGGGGSARLWVNDVLVAVAGGGGGAAGYSNWGGAGGGLEGGTEAPHWATQTGPGRAGDPVRAGRSIAEAGLEGRTGGAGGSGGGDDGAGGGGGFYGGGGGGGDGNAGGGGSGWVHPDAPYGFLARCPHGWHTSGGHYLSDFLDGIGYGPERNTGQAGGDGLAVLYTQTALKADGDAPEVPEPSALVGTLQASVVFRADRSPVKVDALTADIAYTDKERPALIDRLGADVAYDAANRPALVSSLYVEVLRSLRVPPPRRRGLVLINRF